MLSILETTTCFNPPQDLACHAHGHASVAMPPDTIFCNPAWTVLRDAKIVVV